MRVLRIEPPTCKHKKYSAIVVVDWRDRRINFGDVRYEQYMDQTPLRLYKHLDHKNKERRRRYRIRHAHNIGPAAQLSLKYLW